MVMLRGHRRQQISFSPYRKLLFDVHDVFSNAFTAWSLSKWRELDFVTELLMKKTLPCKGRRLRSLYHPRTARSKEWRSKWSYNAGIMCRHQLKGTPSMRYHSDKDKVYQCKPTLNTERGKSFRLCMPREWNPFQYVTVAMVTAFQWTLCPID
jgi:hypothetical protein